MSNDPDSYCVACAKPADECTCEEAHVDTQRAPRDWFVANTDETFSCSACISPDVDPSDVDVEVWELFGSGWTADVHCSKCARQLAERDDEEAAS